MKEEPPKAVEPSKTGLLKSLEKTVNFSNNLPFAALQDLYSHLNLTVNSFAKKLDKSAMHEVTFLCPASVAFL